MSQLSGSYYCSSRITNGVLVVTRSGGTVRSGLSFGEERERKDPFTRDERVLFITFVGKA